MLLMAERQRVMRAIGAIRQLQPRRLANTVTAADIAGVSLRTMYRWIRANKVEYVRTAGGQIRIYVDTLLRRPVED